MKTSENELALTQFPAVVANLDSIESVSQRVEYALRGVFAGNLFDLGAVATANLH